ncbi:sulfate transporter-like [Mytilus californianus]|uniref:sulfate transporter-like n=1 Tax=Mytilus californianus TaxID=6549 RepID=UPI0022459A9D|nr:sulfate transporter-like [Mytilus californianus]
MEVKLKSQDLISIQRRWYSSETLDNVYYKVPVKRRSKIGKIMDNCFCSRARAWKVLTTLLPVIKFIKKYKTQNILGDFLSGLTASFLHLPQGLGFGMLAGLQPINGLYTTFFPILIYMLFGTSPHVSFGSNAVMALLTQTVAQREADRYLDSNKLHLISSMNYSDESAGNNSSRFLQNDLEDIKIGAAMTASLLTGLILAGLGICRLGFLTRYMSVSFIGGFTTAAAIHIASSQVSKMLGISVSPHSGAGKLIKMYIELFSNIKLTIISELVIAIITMILLLTVKILINERYKDRIKIPIPIDFIVVVVGTIVSYFGKFEEKFDVKIVGDIPTGFPMPKVPSLHTASTMIMDCVVMAILSLAMTISLAKLTAKKHGITIDDNQEIIAYGISNIGSSFFSCFPQATAPPRTMVLSNMGAKSTLNAIPTGIIILLIILWIGSLFESLPVAILAAMIIVAMKNLLIQFGDIPRLWRINKFDCIIWLITCSVSVLVDLDYGLMAGIGFSILSIVIQNQMASGKIIGYSDREDIFVDSKNRVHVIEISSIKIFQYQAPLYFANADNFRKILYSQVADAIKLKKLNEKDEIVKVENKEINEKGNILGENVRHIILDFQMISNVDLSGINVLTQIVKEYKAVDIEIYIVKCSSKILETLRAADFFENFPKENMLYDLADAVYLINSTKFTDKNVNTEKTFEDTKL